MPTYTSAQDEHFFGAIGRLTISWAHLELGLDCMVDISHNAFGGNKIDPEMPRALKRKITYLRAIFKQLPIPPESIKGYHALLDQIETAAEVRHDIIHGAITKYIERSGEAEMVRIIRHKKGVEKKRFKKTTGDILKDAGQAQRLGTKVLRWVTQFYDLIDELSQQHDEQKPS